MEQRVEPPVVFWAGVVDVLESGPQGLSYSRIRRLGELGCEHIGRARLYRQPEGEGIGQLVTVLRGQPLQRRTVWRRPGVGHERAAKAAAPRGHIASAMQLADGLPQCQPTDSQLGGKLPLSWQLVAMCDHAEFDDCQQAFDGFLERVTSPDGP